MKTKLTSQILDFLVKEGYNYCLSQTQTIGKRRVSVEITLTPVRKKPVLEKLPPGFDTYFNINEEPRQMVLGVDETRFYVNLQTEELLYLQACLQKRPKANWNQANPLNPVSAAELI